MLVRAQHRPVWAPPLGLALAPFLALGLAPPWGVGAGIGGPLVDVADSIRGGRDTAPWNVAGRPPQSRCAAVPPPPPWKSI